MLPENSLVPDLVTTLTLPAVEPESLTSKSTTLTFTCSTESSDIGERTPDIHHTQDRSHLIGQYRQH